MKFFISACINTSYLPKKIKRLFFKPVYILYMTYGIIKKILVSKTFFDLIHSGN